MIRTSKKILLTNLILGCLTTIAAAQDTTFTLLDPTTGLTAYQLVNKDATSEEGYLLNGKKEGLVRTFFANGVLQTATEYHEDIPNGWYLECEKNGVVLKEEHYKMGVIDGEVRTYTTKQGSRLVQAIYHYRDGKLHGTCADYSDTGKMSALATYSYGIKEGPSRWYYTNGKPAMEQHYVNGELYGTTTSWGPDGKVTQYGNYKHNQKDGEWKEYYTGGQIKSEGSYVADEKTGTWKYYDEEWNLSNSETY